MRLFGFHLNVLTSCLFHLSDDQLLHFPSLSLPCLKLIYKCTSDILFTSFYIVYTYTWIGCSSTLSGHLSSSCICCIGYPIALFSGFLMSLHVLQFRFRRHFQDCSFDCTSSHSWVVNYLSILNPFMPIDVSHVSWLVDRKRGVNG